jgi:hypothetical protein
MNTALLPDSLAGMPEIHANSGGPMSRTRQEHIKSSLLGSNEGVVRCPRRICLRLDFAGDILWNMEYPGDSAEELRKKRQLRSLSELSPVEYLETILKDEGLRDPEELRKKYILPQDKLICGPWTNVEGSLFVYDASNYDLLEQALMLGLCTAQMFDPGRPVLWTETSLTRAVELFDPGSFSA